MTQRTPLWKFPLLLTMISLAGGIEKTNPLAPHFVTQVVTDRRFDDLPELEPMNAGVDPILRTTYEVSEKVEDAENCAEEAKPKIKVVRFGHREDRGFRKDEEPTMVNDKMAMRVRMRIPDYSDDPRALALAKRLMKITEDLQGPEDMVSQAQEIIWLLLEMNNDEAKKAAGEFLSNLDKFPAWKRFALKRIVTSLESTLQTAVLLDTALDHLQHHECDKLRLVLMDLKGAIDKQSTTIGIDVKPLEEAAKTAIDIARDCGCADKKLARAIRQINGSLDDMPRLKRAVDLSNRHPSGARATLAHNKARQLRAAFALPFEHVIHLMKQSEAERDISDNLVVEALERAEEAIAQAEEAIVKLSYLQAMLMDIDPEHFLTEAAEEALKILKDDSIQATVTDWIVSSCDYEKAVAFRDLVDQLQRVAIGDY